MQEFSDDAVLKMLRSSIQQRDLALSKLYDSYYTGIARFVLKNSGNAEDAKDMFQESLIVFYEKAISADFELTGSIKNYLHAVCRNIWFKKLRHAGKEISFEDVEKYSKIEEENDDQGFIDRSKLFAQMMQEVGAGCRDILTRFYFDRQSMKTIAKELNLANEGVAKNKKARCIQKLKELVKNNNSK